MIIQVLLIAATLLIVGYALRRDRGGRQLAVRRLLGSLVAAAGVIAVVRPDAVTWLANLVGVGRGTDLLLYGAVVVFAFVAASLYSRVRELEANLTVVVRELALHDPPTAPHRTHADR